jgi:hypothetical protein
VPEPPLAWKKLREAWFFYWRLTKVESGPQAEEHFDYHLSAFLNAARSAVYKVRFALGSWDAINAWKATRSADDQAFFASMTDLRNTEVHNEGATISREQEAVPMSATFDEHTAARLAAIIASGILSETKVYVDRHYVDLEAERVQAVPACDRFVTLVEDLLRYVDALTTKKQAT